MAKVAKIIALPIAKSGRGDIIDALSEKGITRWGTSGVRKPPRKLRNGSYATGLNENADYIKEMYYQAEQSGDPVKMEAAIAEAKVVKERRLRLERALGVSLAPDAPYYARSYDAVIGSPGVAQRYKLKHTNSFNFDSPEEEVTFWWLTQWTDIIAPSMEHWKSGKCRGAQYYIENPEEEARVLYQQAMSEVEAFVTLKVMDDRRIKKVAKLCGIPVSDKDGYQYIFGQLSKLIRSGSIEHGELKGQNGIAVFTRIADLDDRMLNVKMLVKDAMDMRILTDRNGVIYDGERVAANTVEMLVTDLCMESNEQRMLALEIKVNDKRKLTSSIMNFDYSVLPNIIPDEAPKQTVTVTTVVEELDGINAAEKKLQEMKEKKAKRNLKPEVE